MKEHKNDAFIGMAFVTRERGSVGLRSLPPHLRNEFEAGVGHATGTGMPLASFLQVWQAAASARDAAESAAVQRHGLLCARSWPLAVRPGAQQFNEISTCSIQSSILPQLVREKLVKTRHRNSSPSISVDRLREIELQGARD